MLREGEVYFNDNTSFNLNLFLENYPSIPTTNEEYEEVQVEGRSGKLIINKGTYPDKKIPFTFTILSEEIEIDFDMVYEWLLDTQDNKLIFGRDDRCYKVKKVLIGDLKKQFIRYGEFDVTFICNPFLEDLDETVVEISSSPFEVNCSGNMGAETLIGINATGNIQLTINEDIMQINNVAGYVEIDSNLLQVRNGDGASNDNEVIGNFVRFKKGLNVIKYTGSITKFNLTFTNQYR